MSPGAERRALQTLVAIACCVPLLAGGSGVLLGTDWLQPSGVRVDLDSHFRYLSGIFLGVGLAFASCVPGIERKGGRMRLLAAFVVLGGLARGYGALRHGLPGPGHVFGLGMELGMVPLLTLWQARVARRYSGFGSSTAGTVGR